MSFKFEIINLTNHFTQTNLFSSLMQCFKVGFKKTKVMFKKVLKIEDWKTKLIQVYKKDEASPLKNTKKLVFLTFAFLLIFQTSRFATVVIIVLLKILCYFVLQSLNFIFC